MYVVSCALVPFGTTPCGDDDALPARAPRYHPACHADARPLIGGCDGPTRSVLLGQAGRSSEGSPVIAGSMPLRRFYVRGQINGARAERSGERGLGIGQIVCPEDEPGVGRKVHSGEVDLCAAELVDHLGERAWA